MTGDPTKEHSWVILGTRIKHVFSGVMLPQNIGTPVEVTVDYDWILKREEQHKDVLGFFHTHPSFLSTPSERDDATMDSWVTCLGKDLISVIQGTDGVFAQLYWPLGSMRPVAVDGIFRAYLMQNPVVDIQTLIVVDTHHSLNTQRRVLEFR